MKVEKYTKHQWFQQRKKSGQENPENKSGKQVQGWENHTDLRKSSEPLRQGKYQVYLRKWIDPTLQ